MRVNNLSKVALDSAAAGIEPAISSRTPPSHTWGENQRITLHDKTLFVTRVWKQAACVPAAVEATSASIVLPKAFTTSCSVLPLSTDSCENRRPPSKLWSSHTTSGRASRCPGNVFVPRTGSTSGSWSPKLFVRRSRPRSDSSQQIPRPSTPSRHFSTSTPGSSVVQSKPRGAGLLELGNVAPSSD